MSSKLDRPIKPHPIWCNKRHQAGADPRRQHHVFTWTRSDAYPGRVELYPCNASATEVDGSMSLRVNDGYRGESWLWLDAKDVRDLAHTLLELVELIERGEA